MAINCSEDITPLSAVQGTFLNSRITSFDKLAQRIAYQLGAPLITLEAHINAINEFISIACERFTKFAGYTEEYLLFSTNLYQPKRGIRLDTLFSITPNLNGTDPNGTSLSGVSAMWDYDVNNYRKVVDCFAFNEGQNSGINTLFTLEQSLAQQTYFAYSQGNYGFDLISWHNMKEWIKLREKLLATLIYFKFNQETQYLTIIPEPTMSYVALVGCYVEKPLKDLTKEPWVQDYALSLTKIAIANARGKFAGTQLFGGGSINYSDLMQQGVTEKLALEEKLLTGASAGWGDSQPPVFMIG